MNFSGNLKQLLLDHESLKNQVTRLKQIAVNAHDMILRGNNDKEILDLLETAWSKKDDPR
jgi:hypothetical protein